MIPDFSIIKTMNPIPLLRVCGWHPVMGYCCQRIILTMYFFAEGNF